MCTQDGGPLWPGCVPEGHKSPLIHQLEPAHVQVLVIMMAPSIRVSIGEEVGLAPGEVTTGQIATAQRMLGGCSQGGMCSPLSSSHATQGFMHHLLAFLRD